MYLKICIGFIVLLHSCKSTKQEPQKEKIKEVSERFFEELGKRESAKKMFSFYADVVVYDDKLFDETYYDVEEIYNMRYHWLDKNVQYSQTPILKLEQLIVNDSVAIGSGFFYPYFYKGVAQESLPFMIQLEYDDSFKIIHQTDWFDYPLKDMSQAYEIKKMLDIK